MQILVISASMRAGSQSLKVAEYLAARLHAHGENVEVLDLFTFGLPPYDDVAKDIPQAQVLREKLASSDGFVFVSPEWNGMMSYGLMSMLHYVDKQMADKPVLLVGVSDTRGGFYPVAQMQMIGQKNKFYVILPEHLVISNVKEFMNEPNSEPSAYIEQRADRALHILGVYSRALKAMRDENKISYDVYKNGM